MTRPIQLIVAACALLCSHALMPTSPRHLSRRGSTIQHMKPVQDAPEDATGRRTLLAIGLQGAFGLALPGNALAAKVEYLKEPSAEFLESEAQSAAFKKKQLTLKKKLMGFLDDLGAAGDDTEATDALSGMIKLTVEANDLPGGMTKEGIVKQIRLKKSSMSDKGMWATPVDIEYKRLISVIGQVQSPNRPADSPIIF